MKRNLALDLVRVTEAAALSAARTMGRGQVELTHQAAVSAMLQTGSVLPVSGRLILGEGQKGEVEHLWHGEALGTEGPEAELLVLPIDSPFSCSQGEGYATSAMAATLGGHFLRTPDIYYDKLVVAPKCRGVINLEKSATENLRKIAEVLDCYCEDLTVTILNRPRHTDLIREVREAGARIRLLPGGDVSGAMAACINPYGTDILMGSGRAREGLLAAAAISALGGDMQMRPRPMGRAEQEALRAAGISDSKRVFRLQDLVSGELAFAATGITRSEFLEGVQFVPGGAISQSLAVRSGSQTVRRLVSEHRFDRKPSY